MDQLSPGFSIPSIGTPLHHPEEDQQIVANPYYSQQVGPPQNGLTNSGSTQNPMTGLSMNTNSIMGSSSGMGSSSVMSGNGGMGIGSMGSLPIAPTKLNSYQPSYAPSPPIQQPQTPVSSSIDQIHPFNILYLFFSHLFHSKV